MKKDAPWRVALRHQFAVLVGLATVAGLVVPSLLFASDTIDCNGTLIANVPQPMAHLGWSVSASGEWLATGANQDNQVNQNNVKAGSVALYQNPGSRTNPHPDQEIAAADLQPGDQFGASVSISSSISGGWLAVGAPGQAQGTGAVYLFRLNGSSWVPAPQAKLTASDAARGAQFGFSVSISDSGLVVGAPGDSDRGSLAGSVYVFERQGDSWNQTPELHAGDGRPFDEFGFAVAVAGSQLVVGAPFADDIPTVLKNFGAAYLFTKNGDVSGGWNLKAQLTAEGGFRSDNIQFGASVAISAMDVMGMTQIVVGVPGDDLQNRTDSGSAYVFEGSGANWDPHPLTPEDPGRGAQFGTAVQIDNMGRVVIGARFAGEGGLKEAGAAYLFEKPSDNWMPTKKFIVPVPSPTPTDGLGGAFGQSVAILDGQVFMGGFQYDEPARGMMDAGAVAVCPRGQPQPKPHLTCKKSGPASVDAGDPATYTVEVTNDGTAAATGVILNDPTPAGLTFAGADKPCDLGFPCSLGTIAAGVSLPPLTLKVTFQVPDGCSAPGSITNTATVTGDGTSLVDCIPPVTTTVIRPPRGPSLSCSKQGPSSAKPGDIVTYDITVSNSGCGAAKNVTLSDPTPAGLTYVSGPCVLSPCNLGTIDPNLPQTVTVRFQVPTNPAPPGCSAPISATNIAKVVGSNAPESACSITTVFPIAELEVNVSAPPNVPGGTSFPVAVLVTNMGPQTAQGATVDVSIMAASAIESFPSECSQVGNQPDHFTCHLGDLNCGALKSLNFSVRAPSCVNCAAGSPIGVTADAMSQTFDPTLPNHAAAMTQVICPPGPVRITKTDNPDPVVPGQELVYDIKVENTGTSAVSGSVVEDDFPAELRHVLWCRGAGCTPTLSPPLKDTVDLAAGEAKFYRLSGIVQPMCSAVIRNTAKITPPAGVCDDPSDNQAIEDTQVVANGVLAFCEGISGQWLQFTAITKTFLLLNCGPANQADNPGDEFTDVLPPTLTLTGASATSGVASTSGNTATWNGAIPVGGTVTINITATIVAPAGTTICNQATIAFDADGDGINESIRFSDDPDEPGPADPCCFTVIPKIPALSPVGLAALIILLACVALLRIRRRTL